MIREPVPSSAMPPPVHCPSSHDCDTWANINPDKITNESLHAAIDEDVKAAREALESWLSKTLTLLRSDPTIGLKDLPHGSADRAWIRRVLVDPATTYVLAADTRRGDALGPAAYIGLVHQDPSMRWYGLSGFFLPWCIRCDSDGDATFRYFLRRLFDRLGLVELRRSELPRALAPQAGWFDDDRLVRGARVSRGHTEWRRWPPTETPAVVRTGPVLASTINLVVVQDDAAAAGLEQSLSTRNPAAWTWRPALEPSLG